MSGMSGWTRGLIVAGAALSVTACANYPTEPRYSTRADQPHAVANVPPVPNSPVYPGQPGQPYPGAVVTNEAPPPARAPIESIDGGGLPPAAVTSSLNGGPANSGRPAVSSPNYPSSGQPEPASSSPSYNPPGTPRAPVTAGSVAYVIQPGDTISGVGRRFQTPVQTLIDLNGLGPRASISSGQQIVLPDNAVDTGRDPYATGPAPVGVTVPRGGAVPPPPTPPSGNAALPPARPVVPAQGPIRPPAQIPAQIPAQTPSTAPSAPVAGAIGLQWPVRGDIVRRFGPVGLGERNNGVNIGATAGAPVVASASGRVAYVGDALAGQGLTVLIVHRDGWRTVYGHLGSATVEDGADVRAGQQIGTVGLTAGDGRPSMHFETRHMQGDEPVAIDPLTVLPR